MAERLAAVPPTRARSARLSENRDPALLIYFRLLRTLGSMGVASQSYLRAGISVLLGILILDEQFAATTAVGLAEAVLGVAVINTKVNWRR